ncbi:hypothetical protein C8Q77DRAFT_344746 [Trametes polyzona]|nr:hypothetical protein C8Q77DRAFT_344746 [Trametes polyzona]
MSASTATRPPSPPGRVVKTAVVHGRDAVQIGSDAEHAMDAWRSGPHRGVRSPYSSPIQQELCHLRRRHRRGVLYARMWNCVGPHRPLKQIYNHSTVQLLEVQCGAVWRSGLNTYLQRAASSARAAISTKADVRRSRKPSAPPGVWGEHYPLPTPRASRLEKAVQHFPSRILIPSIAALECASPTVPSLTAAGCRPTVSSSCRPV